MDNLPDLIMSVAEYMRAWGFELPEEVKQRDEREPGREQKIRFENKFYRVTRAYFKRLAEKARRRIEMHEIFYPRKAVDLDEWIGADFFMDDEYDADVIRLLLQGVGEGANLFSEQIGIPLDYSGINKQVLKWAKKNSGLIVETIDKTTRGILKDAIALFVGTPGFTVGDIMNMLTNAPKAPLAADRALMVARTEATRAYSKGNQIGAEQLQAEFPEAEVYMVWMTNNDFSDGVHGLCEICMKLDGMEIKQGETFYPPNPPYQDGFPPYHPNCNCWVNYTMRLKG